MRNPELSIASPVAQQESAVQSRPRIRARTLLSGLLCLGFAFRIATALLYPNVHYPDEFFQTLEPAHGLAFGPSVVTWEFHVGLRSMVFPGVLAGIMRATAWLAPGSTGYLIAIQSALCLLSLTTIFVAYKVGQRAFGDAAGFLCGAICALWYHLIYFAPRALSEVVAAHLLLPGIYFATGDARHGTRKRFFAAGILCALAFMMRVQLAPAVGVLMLYSCRKDWRGKWMPMLAGMVPPIVLFGAVDWITWTYPFQSTYLNFAINLLQHRAAQFGTEPFNFYVRKLTNFFGPMLLFSVVGAVVVRRARLLGYIVLAIVIPHSMLAHKELRFIYPAMPLLLILTGLGIWECAGWLRENTKWKSQWASATTLLLIAGLTASAINAPKLSWHNRTGTLRAMQHLSHTQDACGVALFGVDWGDSGGYGYLHRDIPIFQTTIENPYTPISASAQQTISRWTSFNAMAPAFNYAIGQEPLPISRREYKPIQCWNETCLYKRPGNCATVPGYSTSELLGLMGK